LDSEQLLYLEALQREARLAASLDHPNITRIHDFKVEGNTTYIVMEYVPDSLDKHVRAGQPLPYQRAVEIAIQVCRGLPHVHSPRQANGLTQNRRHPL
jgi:serine/threonine-protein kinase